MSRQIPSEETGLPAGVLGLRITGGHEVMSEGRYALEIGFVGMAPDEIAEIEHNHYFILGTEHDPGSLKNGVEDATWLKTYGPFKNLCEAAGVKVSGQRIDKVLAALVEQDVVAYSNVPGDFTKFEVPGEQKFYVSEPAQQAPDAAPEPPLRRVGRPPRMAPAQPAPLEPPAAPPPPRPPQSTAVPKRFGAGK